MLAISDEAKAVLKDSLDEISAETGSEDVFRLDEAEGEVTLALGSVKDGDEIYDLDGEVILAAPTELVEQLKGTLDTVVTDQGTTLVMSD